MGGDDVLEWVFELLDRMSTPGSNITNVLRGLDVQIKAVTGDSEGLDKAHQKAGEGADRWRQNLESLFKRYLEFEIVKHVAEAVYDLGKEFVNAAIEAAEFEERTSIAFRTLTGSAEAAEKTIAQAKQFSLKSAIPVDEVIKSYQTLLLAKFPPVEIPVILQGASDLSALGGGRVPVEQLVGAFARLRNEGELTSHSLRMLRDSGLDLEQLSKRLGASDVADLTKKLSKNPVDAATGIQAILETIASKEGGVLGTTTVEMANTVTGAIQRIKNGWQIMLGDFEKSPQFAGIRTGLNGIAELFDPSTEKGKKLEETLSKVLTIAGNLINDVLSNLPSFFAALTDQSQPFFDNFKSFWGEAGHADLSGAFTQMGNALLAVADIAQIVLKALEKMGEFVNLITEGFHQMGRAGEHVKNLFEHGEWADNDQLSDSGAESGKALGKGIETGAKDALEIHSPSKVFQELGEHSSAGFSDGFDGDVLEPPKSDGPTSGTPLSPAGGEGGGRGGGPVSITAPVHIEIHGNAGDEEIQRLRDQIPGDIASALEQSAQELGST